MANDRTQQFGHGTTRDINKITEEFQSLLQMPQAVAAEFEESGEEIGRFAVGYRKDFLELVMKTNRELGTQNTQGLKLASTLARVAVAARKAGAAGATVTDIAEGFSTALFKTGEDTTISFLAGRRIMNQMLDEQGNYTKEFYEATKGMTEGMKEIFKERLFEGDGMANIDIADFASTSIVGIQAKLAEIQEFAKGPGKASIASRMLGDLGVNIKSREGQAIATKMLRGGDLNELAKMVKKQADDAEEDRKNKIQAQADSLATIQWMKDPIGQLYSIKEFVKAHAMSFALWITKFDKLLQFVGIGGRGGTSAITSVSQAELLAEAARSANTAATEASAAGRAAASALEGTAGAAEGAAASSRVAAEALHGTAAAAEGATVATESVAAATTAGRTAAAGTEATGGALRSAGLLGKGAGFLRGLARSAPAISGFLESGIAAFKIGEIQDRRLRGEIGQLQAAQEGSGAVGDAGFNFLTFGVPVIAEAVARHAFGNEDADFSLSGNVSRMWDSIFEDGLSSAAGHRAERGDSVASTALDAIKGGRTPWGDLFGYDESEIGDFADAYHAATTGGTAAAREARGRLESAGVWEAVSELLTESGRGHTLAIGQAADATAPSTAGRPGRGQATANGGGNNVDLPGRVDVVGGQVRFTFPREQFGNAVTDVNNETALQQRFGQ